MSLFKQSTSGNVAFLMISNTDNVSPVTGLTPTVTISKNNAVFGSPAGSVSEIGNGWYSLAMTSADTGTLGELLLHATGTGANPADDRHQVVLDLPGASVSSVTGNVAGNVVGSVGSVTGAVGSVTGNVGGNVVGSVASVTGAVGSVTGSVGSVTGAVGSVTGNVGGNVVGSVGSVVATVAANLTQILGTALSESVAGNLAAAFKKFFNISSPTSTMNEITLVDTVTTYTGNTPQTGDSYARLGAPAGASIAADIAEVEAETDGIAAIPTNPLLTSDARLNHLDADISSRAPASTALSNVQWTNTRAGNLDNLDATVSSRLPTSSYTAPDNTDIAAIKAQTDKLGFDGSNNVLSNTQIETAQIEIKKGVAYSKFMFPMTDSGGNLLTGLTVSALLSKDGATPVSTTNAPVQVGNGLYSIDLTSSETNCGTLALEFSAVGAVTQFVTVRTQA